MTSNDCVPSHPHPHPAQHSHLQCPVDLQPIMPGYLLDSMQRQIAEKLERDRDCPRKYVAHRALSIRHSCAGAEERQARHGESSSPLDLLIDALILEDLVEQERLNMGV